MEKNRVILDDGKEKYSIQYRGNMNVEGYKNRVCLEAEQILSIRRLRNKRKRGGE